MDNSEDCHYEHVEALIRHALIPRGVTDQRVLNALRRVPRELFLPEQDRHKAYDNAALPIACGQSISQPLMIGLMLQALDVQPHHHVLEIGAGSGYQAALLGVLARSVVTVERLEPLVDVARANLAACGSANVRVEYGDGSLGWPESAPYDRIIAACAAPHIPEPLKQQLRNGGRMILPVGSLEVQRTVIVRRRLDRFEEESTETCVFVPLLGEEGWSSSEMRQ
ncbi:MAG: protein-L-isoaspartate(D-aspartate) O-methyltransferase [Armatimonadetes bacterium]|nr:protein-L-isoaspartate(D-aspartate) O-methyltransferase [Armatimonadota bacterium]